MKMLLAAFAAAALISAPAIVHAEIGKPSTNKGSSQDAPGQMAKEKGDAKDYAPGQQRKTEGDKPNAPGASEYAPGQQPKPR